jgi:hypothetical protein
MFFLTFWFKVYFVETSKGCKVVKPIAFLNKMTATLDGNLSFGVEKIERGACGCRWDGRILENV